MKKSLRGTGCKILPRAKIDPRDYRYAAYHDPLEEQPGMVDQRPYCGRVFDQGRTNACTGFSVASADETLRKMEGKPLLGSPLFVYWNARAERGWTDRDDGAYIFDAVKSIANYGVSPDKLHSLLKDVQDKPDLWAYSYAWLLKRNRKYYKITDQNMNGSFTDEVHDALARGYVVVGGIALHKEFWDKTAGIVANPGKDKTTYGHHAMQYVGYIDLDEEHHQLALKKEIGFASVLVHASPVRTKQGFFIVKNSWDITDGVYGYFLVSCDYVDDYGNDFWAIAPKK